MSRHVNALDLIKGKTYTSTLIFQLPVRVFQKTYLGQQSATDVIIDFEQQSVTFVKMKWPLGNEHPTCLDLTGSVKLQKSEKKTRPAGENGLFA